MRMMKRKSMTIMRKTVNESVADDSSIDVKKSQLLLLGSLGDHSEGLKA